MIGVEAAAVARLIFLINLAQAIALEAEELLK